MSGGLFRTEGIVLNLKQLSQSVTCTNLIQSEPTRGVQGSLHVRACMHAAVAACMKRYVNSTDGRGTNG